MEKTFAIKESTINAILQYLGKQAYTDVAQIIAGIVTECQQQPNNVTADPGVMNVDNAAK